MEMVHGHEVLQMMEGHAYASDEALAGAIAAKFGADARFYTCSAENLTAAELVGFLKERGKFTPAKEGFTVDADKVCNR